MVRTEDIEAEFEVQLMRISDPSIRKKVVEACGPKQAKEAVGRLLKSLESCLSL